MDELDSPRRSRRGNEKNELYFGTYHHSTSTASRKIRIIVKAMFADAFASLPFDRNEKLMILDVGCGLGFLSCVSAEFFNNSRITGIDMFKHTSLKRSSLEKAKANARILGLSERIDFKKGNVFEFTPAEKFDIIVSNLVIHNFGRMRFEAYSRISSWAQVGSFFLIGDLFFSPETDIPQLTKAFKMLKQIKPKSGFRQYALLVMSKVNPTKKK